MLTHDMVRKLERIENKPPQLELRKIVPSYVMSFWTCLSMSKMSPGRMQRAHL